MRHEDERRAYDHYRSAARYARHGSDAKAHAHIARAVHYYSGPSMFGVSRNKGGAAPNGQDDPVPGSFTVNVSSDLGTGGSLVTATVRDSPTVTIVLVVLDGKVDKLAPDGGPFSDPLGLALLPHGIIKNVDVEMRALKEAMSSRAIGSPFVCVKLMNTTRAYTFAKLMGLMRATLDYLVNHGAISLESTVALIPDNYRIDDESKPREFLSINDTYRLFKGVHRQEASSVDVMVATVRKLFPIVTLGPSHPSRLNGAVPTIKK